MSEAKFTDLAPSGSPPCTRILVLVDTCPDTTADLPIRICTRQGKLLV